MAYLGEVNYGAYYDEQVDELVKKFRVSYNHAGCYLVNYGDISICLASGGCKNLAICNEINKEEK